MSASRIAVLGLLVVGAVLVRQALASPAPDTRSVRVDLPERERASNDEVSREVAALRSEVQSLRRSAAAAEPLPAAQTSVGESGAQTTEDVAPLSSDARRALYEGRFEGDPRDVAWASTTEREIAAALTRPELAGSTIVSAECRSTLCKIEVRHDDPSQQADFLPQVIGAPPFHSAGAAETIHDAAHPERVSTVIYLAREGHEFPRLD